MDRQIVVYIETWIYGQMDMDRNNCIKKFIPKTRV